MLDLNLIKRESGMLIKEEGSKTNFIDKFDNFVGYDSFQSCCEYFGWYISDVISSDNDDADFPVEGFYFDASVPPAEVEGKYDSGGCIAFTLINDSGEKLYLHLFNYHNGYYAHGWESSFSDGGYL